MYPSVKADRIRLARKQIDVEHAHIERRAIDRIRLLTKKLVIGNAHGHCAVQPQDCTVGVSQIKCQSLCAFYVNVIDKAKDDSLACLSGCKTQTARGNVVITLTRSMTRGLAGR